MATQDPVNPDGGPMTDKAPTTEPLREALETANVPAIAAMYPNAGWDVVVRVLVDEARRLAALDAPVRAAPSSLDREGLKPDGWHVYHICGGLIREVTIVNRGKPDEQSFCVVCGEWFRAARLTAIPALDTEKEPYLRERLAEAMRAYEDDRHPGAYPHLGQDNDIRCFAEWIADYLDRSPWTVAPKEPTGERARAVTLATWVLDDATRDPDSDMSVLARQFLRAIDLEPDHIDDIPGPHPESPEWHRGYRAGRDEAPNERP